MFHLAPVQHAERPGRCSRVDVSPSASISQHKRRRRRRRRRRAPRRNFTSLRAENVQDEILGGVPT